MARISWRVSRRATSSNSTRRPSDSRQAHRVRGRPAALGRAARVEDLEAARASSWSGRWEWPNTTASASGKRPPQPREPPARGPASCTIADPRALGLDRPLRGQPAPQLVVVHVAVHREQRRPDRLDLGVGAWRGHEVARVEDQVGAPPAARTQASGRRRSAARHVGVRDDGDQHLDWPTGARSSVDRAPPSGGGSRRFESCRARTLFAVRAITPPQLSVVLSTLGNYEVLRRVLDGYDRQDAPAGQLRADRGRRPGGARARGRRRRDRASGHMPCAGSPAACRACRQPQHRAGARPRAPLVPLHRQRHDPGAGTRVRAPRVAPRATPRTKSPSPVTCAGRRELRVTPFMKWLDRGMQFNFPAVEGIEAN